MSSHPSKRRAHYRILAVSDRVEPRIYGPGIRRIAAAADFVCACGDLPYYYLEYIISTLDRSLYYVHGNHDRAEYRSDKSVVAEPPGGVNLHMQVRHVQGLIIAGLEGSHRYNKNPRYQYTQNEMWTRVMSLAPTLMFNRLLYGRCLDVLVTHSPPFGIHDAKDRPHIGFKAFLRLMRWFKPKYMLHGHQHVYKPSEITHSRYAQTEIINIYPYQMLDLQF